MADAKLIKEEISTLNGEVGKRIEKSKIISTKAELTEVQETGYVADAKLVKEELSALNGEVGKRIEKSKIITTKAELTGVQETGYVADAKLVKEEIGAINSNLSAFFKAPPIVRLDNADFILPSNIPGKYTGFYVIDYGLFKIFKYILWMSECKNNVHYEIIFPSYLINNDKRIYPLANPPVRNGVSNVILTDCCCQILTTDKGLDFATNFTGNQTLTGYLLII